MEKYIQALESSLEAFGKKSSAMVAVNDRYLPPMDLYIVGALNRSHALTSGFCTLVRAQNYPCAVSLVRLNLDNALRLFAAFLVPDPNTFARDLIDGEQINRMRDSSGEKLNDGYLARKLAEQPGFEWVANVYSHTCSYIHLSDKHVYTAIRSTDDNGGVELNIGNTDSRISDESRIDGLSGMSAINNLILVLVQRWIDIKISVARPTSESPRA